jgi:YHS domain-containing protein
MRPNRTLVLMALLICGLASASRLVAAQDAPKSGEPQARGMVMGSDATKSGGKLTKVEDHKKICMVTNKAFEKDQIPIEVEGRTYYGCCEMCKTALANNPEKRTAIDPISNHKVDKSMAVIGVDANGKVLYFENDQNLAAYNSKTSE